MKGWSWGVPLYLTLVASCGRIDFTRVDGSAALPPDARPDAGPAVCGDNICSGDSGELCSSCSDCVTLSVVCGNGACEPGEADCYADCGPLPWPVAWEDEATSMLTALNNARVNGFQCPGTGAPVTAPALVYDTTYEPTAREWAWEAAHENWIPADACNGRTALSRVTVAGAQSIWKVFDSATGQDAITMLLNYSISCPNLMAAVNTKLAGAVSRDVIVSHAIVLR